MWFWLKSLSVKAVWCTKALDWIARQGLETWKHRQFGRSHKTGTIVPQPGSGRPRLSRSSEGPCVQSGGQAKKASVSSFDFARNCHSLFKCIQKNNSPWSPAHMLQTTSCSAVVWSQSYIPSHSLINNVIVCNKSCYCSIINRRLNNQ